MCRDLNRNELVDGKRGAVVEENGQKFYCYAPDEVTLKDGSRFKSLLFLPIPPAKAPNRYRFLELPYGTKVVKKSTHFIVE